MVLAARGARNLDGQEEQIEDPEELSRVRRKAARVHVEAVITAALLTVLFVWLPR